MALWSNTAATDESTPPESPNTTLSLPNCFFRSATVDSTNDAGDQSRLHLQISRKFSSKLIPSKVWKTSGWNCTPQVASPSILYAANSTSSVLAIFWNYRGFWWSNPRATSKFVNRNEYLWKAGLLSRCTKDWRGHTRASRQLQHFPPKYMP